jgi:hypothetical protein
MRRQFQLPEEDEAHLDARGQPWETIIESNSHWLIVHDFPVPEGFTERRVSVAVAITPGYPVAPLDMAYFHPPVARSDGRPIGALSPHTLDGKTWQRWSRHRTEQNPWRPGVDDVAGHLALAEHWLQRELELR